MQPWLTQRCIFAFHQAGSAWALVRQGWRLPYLLPFLHLMSPVALGELLLHEMDLTCVAPPNAHSILPCMQDQSGLAPQRPATVEAVPDPPIGPGGRPPPSVHESWLSTSKKKKKKKTLMLSDGWLPDLLLVAPALKLLSIRVYQHMLNNLPLLLYQPALQAVQIDIETLINPNQLPLLLPGHCTIRKLITRFLTGDVAGGLPPAKLLPRIVSLVASTHEPDESCQTNLAPLSACSTCVASVYL